jgi:hypothetical protein
MTTKLIELLSRVPARVTKLLARRQRNAAALEQTTKQILTLLGAIEPGSLSSLEFRKLVDSREAAMALVTNWCSKNRLLVEWEILTVKEALGELSEEDHLFLLRTGEPDVALRYLLGSLQGWEPILSVLDEALKIARTGTCDCLTNIQASLRHSKLRFGKGVLKWLVNNVPGYAWAVSWDEENISFNALELQSRVKKHVWRRLSSLPGDFSVTRTLFEDRAGSLTTLSEFCDTIVAMNRVRSEQEQILS